MEIGKEIKNLRLKLNMSQERFGHKIGVSGKTISAYEKGTIKPTLVVLEKISEQYNVSLFKKSNREIERKIEELQKNILEIQRLFKESLSF
jgi:transcriptional regulator with XRE-family HTH domain